MAYVLVEGCEEHNRSHLVDVLLYIHHASTVTELSFPTLEDGNLNHSRWLREDHWRWVGGIGPLQDSSREGAS